MKRVRLLALILSFLVAGCSDLSKNSGSILEKNKLYISKDSDNWVNANYINIKYRDTLVDVSRFDSFNTLRSSFIEKAYYDIDNQYLILNLSWTNYHRCDVPEYIWNEFKKADSLGKYYNNYIKWEYDCRLWYIPQYN